MKPLKIYRDACEKIEKYLEEMRIEHYFNSIETEIKVVKVEEELVIFEVREQLKKLIEKEYKLINSGGNIINFAKKKSSKWHLVIEAGGVESHFLARIFEVILEKLNEEKKSRVNEGKRLVKEALDEVLIEFKKYPNRTWYKKGLYYMLIKTNGATLIIKDKSAQKLSLKIREELPSFLRAIIKQR